MNLNYWSECHAALQIRICVVCILVFSVICLLSCVFDGHFYIAIYSIMNNSKMDEITVL